MVTLPSVKGYINCVVIEKQKQGFLRFKVRIKVKTRVKSPNWLY